MGLTPVNALSKSGHIYRLSLASPFPCFVGGFLTCLCMTDPKKQFLPEERYPIPASLSGLFQKKELNDKHLWVVGTLTRHITRQDEEAVDYAPPHPIPNPRRSHSPKLGLVH